MGCKDQGHSLPLTISGALRRDNNMNPAKIREKFGDEYCADERAFIMGIDQRFTNHFASRFEGLTALETCTGAGFTTISLAKTARLVMTVDIDPAMQNMAIYNVNKSGHSDKVVFISGNVLDSSTLASLPSINAVFIDPDWAITGPNHIHRFIDSTTRPPADKVFSMAQTLTDNIALVLPPQIDMHELKTLPLHETQKLYLDESLELLCLYFGNLARSYSETEFHV